MVCNLYPIYVSCNILFKLQISFKKEIILFISDFFSNKVSFCIRTINIWDNINKIFILLW